CARLGHGGRDRLGRRHADRAGRVPRAEHDAEHPALRLCRRGGRRADQPGRRGAWRLFGRRHRESRRHLHSGGRARDEALDRALHHRRRAVREAERPVRPSSRYEGMMLRRTIESREPPVLSVGGLSMPAWRLILLGAGLLVLAVLPFALKNFYIFQITLAIIYAIAILGLNLLTGFNGQFSLGHSAFYAIGAYTTAIMMENYGIAYYWTLPAAGIVCFIAGFLFGLPALRLEGIYLALATFALAIAMPQILKFSPIEHWTGGVQGIVIIKPNAPFGLPINPDQWLFYFKLIVLVLLF